MFFGCCLFSPDGGVVCAFLSVAPRLWRARKMPPFVISLVLVFLAEMGDKTQLVALAFATRYAAQTVLAGVFAATLLVHLFSVVLGELIGLALPVFWVKLLAGAAFVGFGLWTLRGDELEEQEGPASRFGPVVTVAIT